VTNVNAFMPLLKSYEIGLTNINAFLSLFKVKWDWGDKCQRADATF